MKCVKVSNIGTSVGYARQLDPHRQPFPTADGYICIVPYTDESWARIFAILGAPEVLEQERFATRGLRGRNVTALYQEIAALTPRRTTEAWLASLHAASIAAMPVRDIAQIRDDPHLQVVGFFMSQEHPTEGRHVQIKAPVTFGAAHSRRLEHAPALGEHNDFIAPKPGP